MSELQTILPTDTWVDCTWDEYIEAIDNPAYEKAKCYYYNEQLSSCLYKCVSRPTISPPRTRLALTDIRFLSDILYIPPCQFS
jgi:hypothetical protein